LVDHPELLADAVEVLLTEGNDVLAIHEELAARRLLERDDVAK
jgi:hypothetical protein